MELVFSVVQGFLSLLDVLEFFFFSSINEVIARASSLVIFGDSTFGQIFNDIFLWIANRNLGFIADLTVSELIFGGAFIVFILYRLILFIVPVAD